MGVCAPHARQVLVLEAHASRQGSHTARCSGDLQEYGLAWSGWQAAALFHASAVPVHQDGGRRGTSSHTARCFGDLQEYGLAWSVSGCLPQVLGQAVVDQALAPAGHRGRGRAASGGEKRWGARHGAGGGLVRVSAGARAAPLRERHRPGAGGGRGARDQDHARSVGESVSERMDWPDGAPGRSGRPRGPRRARLDSGGSGEGP